jgi:hypothetical protein
VEAHLGAKEDPLSAVEAESADQFFRFDRCAEVLRCFEAMPIRYARWFLLLSDSAPKRQIEKGLVILFPCLME